MLNELKEGVDKLSENFTQNIEKIKIKIEYKKKTVKNEEHTNWNE